MTDDNTPTWGFDHLPAYQIMIQEAQASASAQTASTQQTLPASGASGFMDEDMQEPFLTRLWPFPAPPSHPVAVAMGDAYSPLLDDVPYHVARSPPPAPSPGLTHGSIRGMLDELIITQNAIQDQLRSTAAAERIQQTFELSPPGFGSPTETPSTLSRTIVVNGSLHGHPEQSPSALTSPAQWTQGVLAVDQSWRFTNDTAALARVSTVPPHDFSNDSRLRPLGAGTPRTDEELTTDMASIRHDMMEQEELTNQAIEAFANDFFFASSPASVSQIYRDPATVRQHRSTSSQPPRAYPFQSRSHVRRPVLYHSHPILSRYHSRYARPTPPSRPQHITSRISRTTGSSRGITGSPISRAPRSRDPRVYAARLTPHMLQVYAQNSVLNPRRLPWYSIDLIRGILEHLTSGQTSSVRIRIEELRARAAERAAEREQIDSMVNNLAYLNNFSDSRAVRDAEITTEEALAAAHTHDADIQRDWVPASNIRSPREMMAMSDNLRHRSEFGVESGFALQLTQSLGDSLGLWAYQAWVAAADNGHEEDDESEAGWIDADGRKTSGGAGCIRWIEGSHCEKGHFEVFGIGSITVA